MVHTGKHILLSDKIIYSNYVHMKFHLRNALRNLHCYHVILYSNKCVILTDTSSLSPLHKVYEMHVTDICTNFISAEFCHRINKLRNESEFKTQNSTRGPKYTLIHTVVKANICVAICLCVSCVCFWLPTSELIRISLWKFKDPGWVCKTRRAYFCW